MAFLIIPYLLPLKFQSSLDESLYINMKDVIWTESQQHVDQYMFEKISI